MPGQNLMVTIHEWTPEQKKANDDFYTALRVIWDQMIPWHQLETPFSEAGAQRFRDNMKYGRDGWPSTPRRDDIARDIIIPSRSGFDGLYIRTFKPPEVGELKINKGVYLHIHGGGWTLGSADGEDEVLYRIAKNTGYTVASVEYRLGPKYNYPVPIEDCIDAALYLLSPKSEEEFGGLRIIGGESAGAHLAMSVTLSLRDQGINVRKQLESIVLNYGCYDLSGTPSSRNSMETLVLSSEDMRNYARSWVPDSKLLQVPEVSPLFNSSFEDLPPAIFVVGSDDVLYDDSLFGAIKWHMAENETKLVVFPGSKHGFCRLGGPDSEAGLAESENFVQKHRRNH